MFRIETAKLTKGYRKHCEDRVAVFDREERCVIVVADGAGGIGGGELAAECVIRAVEEELESVNSANQWCEVLKRVDHRITAGESTAAVVDLRSYGIAGASVGDSGAWIIHDGEITNLTADQQRKPLLGSSSALPRPFTHPPLQGLLMLATDGFFNYVKRDALTPMVSQADFYSIPRRCVEMVRLPSGDLWDDIGIVVARIPPPGRQPYSI